MYVLDISEMTCKWKKQQIGGVSVNFFYPYLKIMVKTPLSRMWSKHMVDVHPFLALNCHPRREGLCRTKIFLGDFM